MISQTCVSPNQIKWYMSPLEHRASLYTLTKLRITCGDEGDVDKLSINLNYLVTLYILQKGGRTLGTSFYPLLMPEPAKNHHFICFPTFKCLLTQG